MYTAFFFTMSPEDINELLAMPEEQAKEHIIEELRYRGKQACAEHFDLEFGYLMTKGPKANRLRFTSSVRAKFPSFARNTTSFDPLALHKILSKTFGEVPENGFYDSEEIAHIADDFSEMQETGWKFEVTWALERCTKNLEHLDELVGLMLQITEVFVYAKEHGHIVVTYWG